MQQKCYLIRKEHVPEKARYPVIDAHNHLWGEWLRVDEVVSVMNQTGVSLYCDLTANVAIKMGGGGYVLGHSDIEHFFTNAAGRYPGRFYCFTTANFARPTDQPLFTNGSKFVDETLAILRKHVKQGARGLKILKELGLHYRDGEGKLIACDDKRLAPIWEEAARLSIPVLIHQSDPAGFFEPVTPENEHYDSLRKYPSWSFADPRFPRKAELIERRDRLVKRHSKTTFILPHVGNYPENLSYVGKLLDDCPNVFIDFSARCDELGRQPYTTRNFFINYQDRILFGSDMPPSAEIYRFYFRFLETYDEYFIPPDYDGTFERFRWHVYGLGLPDRILRKIYHANALRIMPGLRKYFGKEIK
jgi:hypothetical protein